MQSPSDRVYRCDLNGRKYNTWTRVDGVLSGMQTRVQSDYNYLTEKRVL